MYIIIIIIIIVNSNRLYRVNIYAIAAILCDVEPLYVPVLILR